MKNKITPAKCNLLFKNIVLGLLLLLTANSFAQLTITNVSPTRVTKGSTITITGTNFPVNPIIKIKKNNLSPPAVVLASGSSFSIISTSATKIVIEINANSNTVFGTAVGNGVIRVSTGDDLVDPFVDSSQFISYINPVPKNSPSQNGITQIYTDFENFWAGPPIAPTIATQPNDSHNLLGFKFRGQYFSTKVDDTKLTTKLSENGITIPTSNLQYYRAFSTRGVLGKTHGSLYLATGDLIDGTKNTNSNWTSPSVAGLTCYDVLVDGINGLDIGTGATNFNQNATVQFACPDGQSGGVGNPFFTDDIPDILLTQIADPGSSDVYYFIDEYENVVGTPIILAMGSFTNLGSYKLDLFKFTNNQDVATAIPSGNGWPSTEQRDMRMAGLCFNDFGIENDNTKPETYINNIRSLSMAAGGTADLAFIAYNTESFRIKSPNIVTSPTPVNICKLPYTGLVTFEVDAGVDFAGDPSTLKYTWRKNNGSTPILEGVGDAYKILKVNEGRDILNSDFATYKVEISNDFGAIFSRSAVIRLGGEERSWDGLVWSKPADDSDSIVFTADYVTAGSNTELKGCDCTVINDVNVTIASGDTMVLQNGLRLNPLTPAFNTPSPNSVFIPAVPAGTLTIEDKGSLVQINKNATNVGSITYKRKATNLKPYDYVYWSSPVFNFGVSNLGSASNPKIYSWNPNIDNGANSTFGNWEDASGTMTVGKGYISRVLSSSDFNVNFVGKPNNGIYDIPITGTANPDAANDYWNLLGNPYPSPISADKFLESNTAIEGTVRIWSHGTAIGSYPNPFYQNFTQNYNPDDYIVYNRLASLPSGFNGFIASGQGFFVKGIANSGTVQFNNLLRYDGLTAYDNSNFYKPSLSETIEKSVIWLSLVDTKEKISSSIAVGYIEGATLEKDRLFDATCSDENDLVLYSIIGENQKFVIQGRPAPFEDTDVIPLGFKVSADGSYTIAIDKTLGVFEGDQEIYLEDKYLNVVHNLRAAPYNFVANKGSFLDRFDIRYTNTAVLGLNDFKTANAVAFIANNKLTISTVEDIQSFSVFDISGKQIISHTFNNTVNEYSNDFNYSQGVYLVKIKFNNGASVTKKLIK